ncbi:uncharacterized protein [Dysidea avara]|uniref:uncharacterized protein n=1 Tax=Dysidea avara TaxID=196820 RepID=UPI00331EB455
MDYLEFAYHRYDNVEKISLGEVAKAINTTGNIIPPNLCLTKHSQSKGYNMQYNNYSCVPILDISVLQKALHKEYSMILILMQFHFKQVYLVEGYKPICIQLTVHYSIENDFHHHLWPLRIITKGKLIHCDGIFNSMHFLPIKNIAYLACAGVLTILVCFTGCVFHFVRIKTYIMTGKMVRDYATKQKLRKPLWSCLSPKQLQRYFWWISANDIQHNDNSHPYVPLKAYVIFCPLLHILDFIFLPLSITGVVLEFTLLRSANTTDEFIHRSTVVSFILGLCSIYFWCTSFRLFNYSKLAGVTIRSLMNSKTTLVLLAAAIVVSFAYVGITLLAWVILGLFHPNFSTFRLSAETFYSLTFGEEIIKIFDSLQPDYPQYLIFITSRVIIGIYGILFSILLLSVFIAIISKATEEKWEHTSKDNTDDGEVEKFNWRVLLDWATTDSHTPFPGKFSHKDICNGRSTVRTKDQQMKHTHSTTCCPFKEPRSITSSNTLDSIASLNTIKYSGTRHSRSTAIANSKCPFTRTGDDHCNAYSYSNTDGNSKHHLYHSFSSPAMGRKQAHCNTHLPVTS